MKKIIKRIVRSAISIDDVIAVHEERKIEKCLKEVTIGKNSYFYAETKVTNLKNDRSLICIGQGTHIRGELLIYSYGGKIEIGDNCYIGEGTKVWSGEHIKLGNGVLISHNVNIMDFAHERNAEDRREGFISLVKYGHPKTKGKIPTGKIVIEDDVAIYAGAHVPLGITIGKGAVLAAGCVVVSDVPPFTLMAGNPARAVWKLK